MVITRYLPAVLAHRGTAMGDDGVRCGADICCDIDLLLLVAASGVAQVTSSPGGHGANEGGSCFLIRHVAVTKATSIWQVALPNGEQGLHGPGG